MAIQNPTPTGGAETPEAPSWERGAGPATEPDVEFRSDRTDSREVPLGRRERATLPNRISRNRLRAAYSQDSWWNERLSAARFVPYE
jgi:hypothetical protein